MRVHLCGDVAAGQFAEQLLAIGDGKYTPPDVVQLPDTMETYMDSMEQLVSKVYPNLLSNFTNLAWLSERCILAPLNKTTYSIRHDSGGAVIW